MAKKSNQAAYDTPRGNVRSDRPKLKAQHIKGTMSHRVPSIAAGLRVVTSVAPTSLAPYLAVCLALWLVAAAVVLPVPAALAQNSTPAPDQQAAAAPDAATVDEYAEAQRVLNGPAGNPECVWLGRRVVSLLWRDDLDTAFRHLDLYDRFGCPSGHIQATFRCLVLHANTIDPKAADSLNGRVHACWINPALQAVATPAPAPAAPSAAAPSQTTTH
jgi:hypothetical protein